MAAVADLERLLERVFERTSARIFRSRVQLVQAERRVERKGSCPGAHQYIRNPPLTLIVAPEM